MKKFYSLLLCGCMSLNMFAATNDLDPATVLADTLYDQANYTVPSYAEFLIAKEAAKKDASQANLQALVDKVAGLTDKEQPYNMVATINGDPHTQMGFCWFTNDNIYDGEVQLIAQANATEADFANAISISATTKRTKAIHYTGICTYIRNATGIAKNTKYRYISHKALAENLTPGTEYSWRVGYEGHWSKIAHFRTQDDNQGEFSFIYMSDSHIMNPEYVTHAHRCAKAAVKTCPDARFCVFPGDFVEDGESINSEWEWERWFEESLNPVIMHMPIAPTDGNHDDSPNLNYTYHFNTNNDFEQINSRAQFDGIIYSFVYGDALFLVFSMQDFWRQDYSYVDWTSVYLHDVSKWFRQETAKNPNTKYRISLSHFNLFSGSDHSTDSEPPLFRACMLPTMKACEIDVALQGHDHTYEVIGPVNPDDCTPILSAITDRETETIDANKNVTGYKGGTYCTDDGSLYFIGATCGRKRYYPHDRARMEREYAAVPSKGKHNVKNYFDLFTGMFGQPEKPSFTKITVKEDCIEFNSYTADDDEGNATLFNTMRVVRSKEHSIPETWEGMETPWFVTGGEKFTRDGQMFIRLNGRTFNAFGQEVTL